MKKEAKAKVSDNLGNLCFGFFLHILSVGNLLLYLGDRSFKLSDFFLLLGRRLLWRLYSFLDILDPFLDNLDRTVETFLRLLKLRIEALSHSKLVVSFSNPM